MPRSWATAEVDDDHLLRFGLDARARSGLHACFRRTDGEDAASRRGEALFTALTESDVHSAADNVALRQFIDVFAEMPEVDFSPEWLERLESRWRQLRQAGCSEDMPLRVVQAMVVHASRELLAGRSALSALEVEIVTALSAGGICIAESLTRAGRRESCAAVIDNLTAIGAGDVLLEGLSAALREAGGKDVGLLSVRLRMRSGTLTLGRDQRDVLMDAAVQRIGAAMRAEDVVVRTDLHSCAVILTNLQTHAQVQLAAAKVSQLLEQPLPVQGTNVRATFLVGAVWAPAHGESAEELIRCADISIEAADREDRSIVLFDDRMLAAARHEAMIEKEFVVAMENGQLQAHVQPQIDLASWRCIGGEVLLRWTDSAGNEVPAASIPEVALRVGAAAQLTRWLVFGACRVLNDLVKAGIDMQLSVNLMARDVMDPELPLLVEQAIKFWRVPPEKLVFELIESAVLEDPGVGAEVMTRLIELGVSTSIDDFGIGYSSILYLRRLPLDELKIDRAFVDVMFRSNEDREIVATLIRLAHGLGLHVVAEGVENEETMNLLCEMGCDRAQGYWISRAMPASALPEWFENWNRRHASAD
ncbi:MAG: GGDEF domain-containing phosphodiesterase [Gammaproteobacteria bacterium]|nr:GGDEF domain-containing phosphodiesterase [Gammaproteobacteria bacterium]MBU1414046.1 GGDEF domain-containing phosphodiesterase [Gammaproteobacteria bacterium]